MNKARNLRFLVDFMKAAGVGTNQVAQLMGVSRQAVHHWFVKDDMKVSQIQRLFELCGYKIAFALEKEVAADTLPVRVTMSVVNPAGPQRLAFLKNALDRYDVSRESLAARLNVGKTTLYNWFKSDDCFLSYVYAIAMAEDMKLDIRIAPL
ncbi:MAG: helix-turn-helix domain-containing protein [Bacteroidales bacterium]|nr:helix-turn-helix domain-containing protein [Bacteroidales bacterium]